MLLVSGFGDVSSGVGDFMCLGDFSGGTKLLVLPGAVTVVVEVIVVVVEVVVVVVSILGLSLSGDNSKLLCLMLGTGEADAEVGLGVQGCGCSGTEDDIARGVWGFVEKPVLEIGKTGGAGTDKGLRGLANRRGLVAVEVRARNVGLVGIPDAFPVTRLGGRLGLQTHRRLLVFPAQNEALSSRTTGSSDFTPHSPNHDEYVTGPSTVASRFPHPKLGSTGVESRAAVLDS